MSWFKTNKRAVLVIIFASIGIGISWVYFVPAQTTFTVIPESASDKQRNDALGIAQRYIVTVPTFAYDGIINTLNTEHVDVVTTPPPKYLFTFTFDSENTGYGTRQDTEIEKGITHHSTEIMVSEGQVVYAITDKIWDEVNHKLVTKPQTKLGSSNDTVEFNGKVEDFTSFTGALKSRGLDVKLTEEIPDSFFLVPTKTLSVSGIQLQTYEFTSEHDTAKAKATISENGTQIGTNSVRWMDVPHFYSAGKIIVQYVGHNPEMESILESLFAGQFAGGT